MTFTLQPFIQDALTKQGIEALMPVQEKVLPYFDLRQDVFVTAPTGSGKTLAYLLPVINNLETNTLD